MEKYTWQTQYDVAVKEHLSGSPDLDEHVAAAEKEICNRIVDWLQGRLQVDLAERRAVKVAFYNLRRLKCTATNRLLTS